MDYEALCRQIMAGLKARHDRMPIYQALSQLPSPDHVPKLLNAWNRLYPKVVLFGIHAREAPRQGGQGRTDVVPGCEGLPDSYG